MSFYKNFLFPVLRRTDPESAHERALGWLQLAQDSRPGRAMLRRLAGEIPDRPVEICGLRFPNVLGIAAGFDKDVRVVPALGELGFGHVEVGTLTPRSQPGNPKPRIFRLPKDKAIINRMGFPNEGVKPVIPRLKRFAAMPRTVRIGVSLGKQKETPLADAAEDYLTVMRAAYPYADYLAVNISSPNTPGLRELQGANYLHTLCEQLQKESWRIAEKRGIARRPLFVKIAPDLTHEELDDMLAAILDAEVDGIIATNTTLSRKGIHDIQRGETGGLSGRPLRRRSTEIIRYIHRETQGNLPIIGAGGIFTAQDAQEKLDAGASLLQVYTGFIYEGPGMAGSLLRKMNNEE
jgi:dihydroorotate dehydrogenase